MTDTKRCKTCLYWDFVEETDGDFGMCVKLEGAEWRDRNANAYLDIARATSKEGTRNLYLSTREDFGCVLWAEAK